MFNVAPTPDGGRTSPRFAVMPLEILRDPGLSDAAKLLYAELDGRVTSKGIQQIRQDTVAANLGWSLRKVQRASAELSKAGHITVRRTRASSLYSVTNTARNRPAGRSRDTRDTTLVPAIHDGSSVENDTSGGPDTTPVAGTYRNTNLRNKSKQEAVYQTRSARGYTANSTTTAAPVIQSGEAVENYLQAISETTGIEIEANRATRPLIDRIKSAGLSATDAAQLVAAQLSASTGERTNPAGFIVKVILPGLVETPVREPSPMPSTPTPPTMAEIRAAEPCEHGEPRGAKGCPLCRRTSAPSAPVTAANKTPEPHCDPASMLTTNDPASVLKDALEEHIHTWKTKGSKVAFIKAHQTAEQIYALPGTSPDYAEAMRSWLDYELTPSLATIGTA
jgi:hypothetical protein